MSKFNGGIIHPTARYRTQTSSVTRGVYDMKEQYLHRANGNWHSPLEIYPNDSGEHIPTSSNLYAVAAGSADDTQNFRVTSVDFDAAKAVKATGRLYFAIRVTASTAYLNDFCIGAVSIESDDFSNLDQCWGFHVLSDYTSWEYATITGLNTVNAGYENYTDIINAPSQNWASCVNGSANGRISRSSSTGSTGTGAADGIAKPTDVPGGSSVAQSANHFYMYTEATGNQANMRNKWFWIRSPEFTATGDGDQTMTIYWHAASPSVTGMQDGVGDELLRWWWA